MAVTVDLTWAKGGRHPLQIKGSPGDRIQSAFVIVTFDASYPAGGETIDLGGLFKEILAVIVTPAWDSVNSIFVSGW